MEKTPENKITKLHSSGPSFSSYNPFDSDSESETISTSRTGRTGRQLSHPSTGKSSRVSLFSSNNDSRNQGFSASPSLKTVSPSENLKYKSKFCNPDIENQNAQELEHYAVHKAEETTEKFKSCLRIAEDIREDVANTLVTLDQQGEQITRTHREATKIEQDLSLGEKLLGSLGGIFSKPWGPKKTRSITGPLIMRNSSKIFSRSEERKGFGLSSSPTTPTNVQKLCSNPSTPLDKVEVEKAKQDGTLSEISNLLDQLKDMTVDMGSEIGRHDKALDHLHDDVDELNFRLKGAIARGRRLLGK